MDKRYMSLIPVMVVGIYVYYTHYTLPQSSVEIKVTHGSQTLTTANKRNNEVLSIPNNFDILIATIDHETKNVSFPSSHLLAINPFNDDNQLISSIDKSQSLAIDSNINLLTGSELWEYIPNLKEQIELEQQIFLPSDSTVMQLNEALLKQLAIGDSLILSLPNNGEQQIIIASIHRKNNNVIIWELQNTQRQDIGKITQVKAITEGSFITDDKQEYHLRTVKNKGWIASKDQLINNNNQAVMKNKQPFAKQFLNVE